MVSDKAAESIVHTQIRPVSGVGSLNLHELWEYRELLFFFLWRDIKGRYRQTAFGPLWMIATPLMNMVLFTIVFGKVARLPSEGVPYPLFNYSALLPWGFFSSCLFTTANSLLSNKDLIAKVYFPRLIAPIVGVLAGLIDFVISFIILLGMMCYYGYYPSWGILYLPVFLLLGALIGFGVGLWWASWIVHYRDLSTVLGYAARVWMYATPVVYASSLVPQKWQTLYHLNPVTNMIEGIRWALLGVGTPPSAMLWVSFMIAILILIPGAYYFRRTERSIVDIA